MAVVKGIQLLHKRYTLQEWTDGTGLTKKPTLVFGEFGIATDTKEVRCNTSVPGTDGISFKDATLVSFPKWEENQLETGSGDLEYIKSFIFDSTSTGGGASLTVEKGILPTVTIEHDKKSQGAFITSIEVDKDNKHKLIYTLGDAPTSTLEIKTPTHSGTKPVEGTSIAVVSELSVAEGSSGHDHKIAYKTVSVPTVDYVSNIVNAVGIELNEVGEVTDTSHIVGLSLAADKRTLTATYAEMPETPVGTGEIDAGENSKSVVASVKLEDHTLSGTTKMLDGKTNSDGAAITVTSSAGKIEFELTPGVYALKSEMSEAMVFRGTLGSSTANPTITNLPAGSAETLGDSYKVISKGTYTVSGTSTSLECDIGDLVVCAKNGNSYNWIVIPAGDDVDDFVNSISVGTGLEKTGTDLSPTISHKSYSSADKETYGSQLTETDYGYDGTVLTQINLDSDDLGHVTKDPTVKEISVASVAGARKIAKEEDTVTIVTGSDKIEVSEDTTVTGVDHKYTITHKTVTKNDDNSPTASLDHSDTLVAVTGVSYDNTGHVNGVTTTTYTLPSDENDYREIKVNGNDFLKNSSTTAVNFVEGTPDSDVEGIKIESDVSTGKITIKSLGKATSSSFGFVKLGTDTKLNAGDSRSYAVGTTADNKLYVNVPWENTDVYGHRDDLTDTALRFCAVQRDKGGHITSVEDILTIDGNNND